MKLPEFVKESEIIGALEARGEENPYKCNHAGGPVADLEDRLEWKNKEIFLLCTRLIAAESELQKWVVAGEAHADEAMRRIGSAQIARVFNA